MVDKTKEKLSLYVYFRAGTSLFLKKNVSGVLMVLHMKDNSYKMTSFLLPKVIIAISKG